MLQLSLSCDRASLEVGERFKLTNSGVQDMCASEELLPLSFVATLASSLRPAPGGASRGDEAREERSGRHLIETLVLLPAGTFYYGTRKHYLVVKCTSRLFFLNLQKAEIQATFRLRAARLSSPWIHPGAFRRDSVI
jgi:hypothetical protein